MKLPQDFREYLELFNAKGVEYMSEERSEPTKHRCHRPEGDSRKSPPLGSNFRARRNVFEKTYGLYEYSASCVPLRSAPNTACRWPAARSSRAPGRA